jgi:hypothetical protein
VGTLEQEKKGKRKREAPEVAPLERFEEGELQAAKLLIEEEAQAMRAALGHPLLDPVEDAPVRRSVWSHVRLQAAKSNLPLSPTLVDVALLADPTYHLLHPGFVSVLKDEALLCTWWERSNLVRQKASPACLVLRPKLSRRC